MPDGEPGKHQNVRGNTKELAKLGRLELTSPHTGENTATQKKKKELNKERAQENCRGFQGNPKLWTDQCMNVKKLPHKAEERTIGKNQNYHQRLQMARNSLHSSTMKRKKSSILKIQNTNRDMFSVVF